MDDKHGRILIVGAGLAGLALARALGQAGFTPELIEGQAGWEVAGTGMYLPANGVRALRTLGLDEAVAAQAAPIPHQRLLDHRGRRLADIDLQRLWGSVGPCLALPRAHLHEILREGVPVRMGRTIRSLDRRDGPVQVGFDDGRGGDDLDGDPVGHLRQRFAGFAAPVPALLEQLQDPARIHVAPDRAGRRRAVGSGGGDAGRRRRPRHVPQHGPGRRPGLRGRPGPGRLPA